jgi:hypothetical protein
MMFLVWWWEVFGIAVQLYRLRCVLLSKIKLIIINFKKQKNVPEILILKPSYFSVKLKIPTQLLYEQFICRSWHVSCGSDTGGRWNLWDGRLSKTGLNSPRSSERMRSIRLEFIPSRYGEFLLMFHCADVASLLKKKTLEILKLILQIQAFVI